jgi:hypothetical protein
MPSTQAKLTKRMHNKDPHCHWCGKETFFNSVNGLQYHDTATTDHVYSKRHMAIRIFYNPKVLACYECNQRRNDEEQAIFPSRPDTSYFKVYKLKRPLKIKFSVSLN